MSVLMKTQDVCRCIGREISDTPFAGRIVRSYEPGYLFKDVRISYAENGLIAFDFHDPDRRVVFSADALRQLADRADQCASAGEEPIQPIDTTQ